jgi:hypothetical protein
MTGTQQVEAAHEIAADLVDHPDPVGELVKEFPGTDPDTIAEAKQAHKELLKDQEVARKEQAKDPSSMRPRDRYLPLADAEVRAETTEAGKPVIRGVALRYGSPLASA